MTLSTSDVHFVRCNLMSLKILLDLSKLLINTLNSSTVRIEQFFAINAAIRNSTILRSSKIVGLIKVSIFWLSTIVLSRFIASLCFVELR